jgi:hypothetical protein
VLVASRREEEKETSPPAAGKKSRGGRRRGEEEKGLFSRLSPIWRGGVVAEYHGNELQFHLSMPKTSKQWDWKNSVPIPMSRSEYLHGVREILICMLQTRRINKYPHTMIGVIHIIKEHGL